MFAYYPNMTMPCYQGCPYIMTGQYLQRESDEAEVKEQTEGMDKTTAFVPQPYYMPQYRSPLLPLLLLPFLFAPFFGGFGGGYGAPPYYGPPPFQYQYYNYYYR